SPVPTYMTLASCGSMTTQPHERLLHQSSTWVHEAPPLSLFQRPPLTAPTQMRCGLVGSIAVQGDRPATLSGPRWVHARGLMPPASGMAATAATLVARWFSAVCH